MAGVQETSTLGVESAEEEVANLKEMYKEHCRVLHNIGEFTHVVDVSLDGRDIGVKFQIKASYPTTVPLIIIKSGHLSHNLQEELLQYLSSEAAHRATHFMLHELVTVLEKWCDDKLGAQKVGGELSPRQQRKQPKRKERKGGRKHNSTDEEEDAKKSSMKTAEDVISRIIWDTALPSEHFLIGYLDRFVGVVEKNFAAFSWEDLASADYETLAIPKHRIQYFKYKNTKIWDKNIRLDIMFGSTGSRETIQELMQSVDDAEMANAKCVASAQEGFADYDYGDSSDDSEEDDVKVSLGGYKSSPKPDGATSSAVYIPPHKRRSNQASISQKESHTADAPWPRQAYWGSRIKPTHFLCLRITDPEIIENMQAAHDKVLEIEPKFYDCIIPTYRLHLTLCCLGLDDEEQVNRAARSLQRLKPKLQELQPQQIKVTFKDVGNFYNKVLFAQVQENEHFLNFVDKLRAMIREEGIEIRDIYSFNPHLTVMKLSARQGKALNNPYIDGRCYKELEGHNFGSQGVDNVHMCEMSDRTQGNDGFYFCDSVIKFE